MVKNLINAPLLTILLLASTTGQAQFKKAKYKSRFKKENFKSSPDTSKASTTGNTPKVSIPGTAKGASQAPSTQPAGNTQQAPNVFGLSLIHI